ncbi:hypothetical protein OROMI_012390 [Orobanche minor]
MSCSAATSIAAALISCNLNPIAYVFPKSSISSKSISVTSSFSGNPFLCVSRVSCSSPTPPLLLILLPLLLLF